ncbi:MAG: cbb3-type cytochrome oxidase assembly protein CcoS [Gammaproteobacteria bacterium]|nr:cbb3-type cytochrome oxidase assembly protein CcoS [Gammaproteobacteria bacterium]
MEILYLLIPLSLVLVGLIIWVFLWAVRSGQFDDLEGPAHQILMDDDRPATWQSNKALDETDGKPPATPE